MSEFDELARGLVEPLARVARPAGVPSGARVGVVGVVLGVALAGVPSAEAVGRVAATGRVELAGVASGEAAGRIAATVAPPPPPPPTPRRSGGGGACLPCPEPEPCDETATCDEPATRTPWEAFDAFARDLDAATAARAHEAARDRGRAEVEQLLRFLARSLVRRRDGVLCVRPARPGDPWVTLEEWLAGYAAREQATAAAVASLPAPRGQAAPAPTVAVAVAAAVDAPVTAADAVAAAGFLLASAAVGRVVGKAISGALAAVAAPTKRPARRRPRE